MGINKKQIIDASNFSLGEWLNLLFDDYELVTPNNHFPNVNAKEEYLKKVKKLPEKDVKQLLWIFLQKTGYREVDYIQYNYLKSQDPKRFQKAVESSRFWKTISLGRNDLWEGTTWIIDLLPDNPIAAINTLDAYFYAHRYHISDAQIWSNDDCSDIILTRYYDFSHPKSILSLISPKEFEWVVGWLFEEIGYKTELTSDSYDEGFDVLARKNEILKKEETLIQCKKWEDTTIGVTHARELLGVVTDKKATRGVLIATSKFSRECIKFTEKNPRIELIDYKKLNRLLNMHFGTNWPIKMRRMIKNKRNELNRSAKLNFEKVVESN